MLYHFHLQFNSGLFRLSLGRAKNRKEHLWSNRNRKSLGGCPHKGCGVLFQAEVSALVSFSAVTLLGGRHERHWSVKKLLQLCQKVPTDPRSVKQKLSICICIIILLIWIMQHSYTRIQNSQKSAEYFWHGTTAKCHFQHACIHTHFQCTTHSVAANMFVQYIIILHKYSMLKMNRCIDAGRIGTQNKK